MLQETPPSFAESKMDELIEFTGRPTSADGLHDEIDELFDLFVDLDALMLDPQFLPDFIIASNSHPPMSAGSITQLPDEGHLAPAPPKNTTSNPVSIDKVSQLGRENGHEGDLVPLEAPSLPEEHEASQSRKFALHSFN
jgi:hypothetical protein